MSISTNSQRNRNSLLIGVLMMPLLLVGCVTEMDADFLIQTKTRILAEFIRENSDKIPTNDVAYIAYRQKDQGWIDPPTQVIAEIRMSVPFRCLPVSKAEIKNGIVVDGHVFSILITWDPDHKVYEYEVGRYTAQTSGYGHVGEIRRVRFRWVTKRMGGWTS